MKKLLIGFSLLVCFSAFAQDSGCDDLAGSRFESLRVFSGGRGPTEKYSIAFSAMEAQIREGDTIQSVVYECSGEEGRIALKFPCRHNLCESPTFVETAYYNREKRVILKRGIWYESL